ncbi:hypothetical protein AeRB84_018170 [Aphanomyces euteiches]|nr:hypothetical protein AeRB84_018170 [Aphanomyces euteiches]
MTKGKLRPGAFNRAAAHFQLHRTTISKVWKAFNTSGDMSSKKFGRVGRKATYIAQDIHATVREIPQTQRTTFCDMPEASGISTGTLARYLKLGTLQRKSSRLKPLLNDQNKRQRLWFCCSHVDRSAHAGAQQEFDFFDMFDVVHLDEKWFNADKDRRKVYLTKDEAPEVRRCKSKRFIPKVMFLAAVARPRWDNARSCFFDGKIGMWPFVVQVPAARGSRNRPAGTMVTKVCNVTAEAYRDFVVNKVIPAVKSEMPSTSKCVVLQHDNATPHRSVDDAVLSPCCTDGWTFRVSCQPPNSPDPNVLDLGFFASIQALQYKVSSRSVDDVIRATLIAFETLSSEKLSDIFLTLQAVMRLVIEHQGSNQFKLPHLGKNSMRRTRTLMKNVTCPAQLVHTALAQLQYHAAEFQDI